MLDGESNLAVVDHYAVQWSSNRGSGRSEVKGTKRAINFIDFRITRPP